MIFFLALFLAGCSGNTRKGDALSAHQTAEKVKDSWSKMSKPLEIEVTGRTKGELEAIGSLAVWLDGMEGGKAVEFRFDGKVFKPTVPVLADSTASPHVCYPFLPSLHPADTVTISHPLGERLAGQIQSVTQTNIIRKTKCFDFWERNVLFPKTKRSFFRTPKHPLPCPFPLNFSLLIITKKFGNLAKNRYICIV